MRKRRTFIHVYMTACYRSTTVTIIKRRSLSGVLLCRIQIKLLFKHDRLYGYCTSGLNSDII
jgi:hypothetical protein